MHKMKTLHERTDHLEAAMEQLEILNNPINTLDGRQTFSNHIISAGMYPLLPISVDTLQVNLGYMCNQTCSHCHVDAGPGRKEIMTRETMQWVIEAAAHDEITTIDLTGGAPEMNPFFRWFVSELATLGKQIIVRSNLTIIVSNKKYNDLPEFFKKYNIELVSSLPFYNKGRTDRQRGVGVFDKSIQALKLLNDAGYGIENTGYKLNLVYNPAGAFLPASQQSLENEFRARLQSDHDIEFNHLFTITNMPISRFLDYLVSSGNYEQYMTKLVNAFNPMAAKGVMCRNLISVGWNGLLYDCDFNQMLGLQVNSQSPKHIKEFNYKKLAARHIVVNQHCFGCTAGAGSSCGGVIAG